MILLSLFFLMTFLQAKDGPRWVPIESPTKAHLRGLSLVNERVIWTSGTGGTFARSIDGGKTWRVDTIAEAEGMDLRDIHAFDERVAYVMTAGADKGMVLKTVDGGLNWSVKFQDHTKGLFFDGIAFKDRNNGLLYGDPLHGYLYMVRCTHAGEVWDFTDLKNIPPAREGEASFAASGTAIFNLEDNYWIATGNGPECRVYHSTDLNKPWNVYSNPLRQGEGMGIFSLSFKDSNNGVSVGGSYIDSLSTTANCAITSDGGKTWKLIEQHPPSGYRSCVAYSTALDAFVTVGRNGSDISYDKGQHWTRIGEEGYYSCQFAYGLGFAVGKNGKMAVLWK